MKAAVCRRYGPTKHLEIQDVTTPTPRAHDVLVHVKATTVSSGDYRLRSGNFPRGMRLPARLVLGWTGPRKAVLGTELSGVVAAVGSAVTRFKPGDEVLAYPGMKLGAHAEYCMIPEAGAILKKPANLSFEEAAALGFGGLTALYFLRDRAAIKAGESLLVVGASGAVGVAVVQLASQWGADVTAVCSGKNEELVRSLGAKRVIDYTRTDFRQSNASYDVIFDTTGTVSPQDAAHLHKNGRLILASADLPQMLQSLARPGKEGRKILVGTCPERAADLQILVDLAARGHYKAVLDRSYPFKQIAEAHAYVETGRKRGSVVVTFP